MTIDPSPLSFTPLHPTFGARVDGLDFSKPFPDAVQIELRHALERYGLLVARKTSIDDQSMLALGTSWGELENVTAHKKSGLILRIPHDEIFDVGNIDHEDKIITGDNPMRAAALKGNALWHADGGYNPRRSGLSILRAVELPPPSTGGSTEYLDSRTAYEDLPEETKQRIEGLVGCNSLLWNRQQSSPEMEQFSKVDVLKAITAKHKLAQIHEPTGRGNLYVCSYNHHVEGLSIDEGRKLIDELLEHLFQDKYKYTVEWESPGDIAFWDNTAVLHRARIGTYHGKYRRDMRRISTFDDSSYAYGENQVGSAQFGLA
ncbi:MAG: TauD/TfdA dioxygenase family protein [Janthinobacterium lividum]